LSWRVGCLAAHSIGGLAPAIDSPKIGSVDRFRKRTGVFRGMDCRTEYSERLVAAMPWVATESHDRASKRLFGGFLEVVLSLWSLWSWLSLCVAAVVAEATNKRLRIRNKSDA